MRESGRRKKAGSALDESRGSVMGIGCSGAVAPDRAWPSRIRQESPDHVDMELVYDVAERAHDIIINPAAKHELEHRPLSIEAG